MGTPMLVTGLLIRAKAWKHSESPSVDEWIKKLRYTYMQWDKCSVIEKTEILPFVATWMDLESIVKLKDPYNVISFKCEI